MVEFFIYFLIVNRQYFFKNSNNFRLKGYLFISFCYFSMKYDPLDSSLNSAIKHSLTYSILIKKLLVNIFYIYIYKTINLHREIIVIVCDFVEVGA